MTTTIKPYTVPSKIDMKIKTAIALKKELEVYEKEIKQELLEAMKDHNIISIKTNDYTISKASRATYISKTNNLPEEFKKLVLDTSKIATYEKLYGDVPDNIEKKTTEYITWRAK